MGIAVRDLTFGGRGRAEHAPYPQMWPLTTAIPRDPDFKQSSNPKLMSSKAFVLLNPCTKMGSQIAQIIFLIYTSISLSSSTIYGSVLVSR